DKLGFLKQHNLTAKFVQLTTGQQASSALLSGSLNVVYFDPDSAAALLNKGVALKFVLNEQMNDYDLMTSAENAKLPLADLLKKLQTVGAPSVGGGGASRFKLIASAYGENIDRYKIVADSGGVGFISGNEDAVMVSPTSTCTIETKGGAP